jgi:salicylate hydroxylase
VALEHIHVRRWEDGRLLTTVPVNKTFGQQVVIHRADLHNALIEKALALDNVHLHENSVVADVTFNPASVTLANGTVLGADVVIGADGIKSTIRGQLLEDSSIKAIATGDAAYRIMLPRSVMEQDPELKQLIDEPQATRWLGPSRHIIAYPVRNHDLYNVVLLHPDGQKAEESWTTKGSKQEMVDNYKGWDPKIRKIIDLVDDDEVLEWKLCLHRPLKTWTRGSVALMGDACHPMLYVDLFFILCDANTSQSLCCPGSSTGSRRRRGLGCPPLDNLITVRNSVCAQGLRAISEAARRDCSAVRIRESHHVALARRTGATRARCTVPGIGEWLEPG